MTIALIIAGSVLAGLLLIAFIIWAHQYTKAGPNEVLIISGRRGRRAQGPRIVRGGGTFVWPFREQVQRLSLELMQFDVRTGETYSSHGVPMQVDGVCMVKVDPTDEGIQLAAEQFLSRGRDDIVRTAQQAVEGHLRSAVGAHSIEDVYRERAKLVEATKELTAPDLKRMGLEIVSLTIRQIADKQGYLEALGRPRTAQVKRDAVRGEAEAEREARAARYTADTSIEESRRDFEIQKATFKQEGQQAQAITQQQVRAQELQVEIVERQKAIELMDAEVRRRVNELEAEVIEPAKSEARKIESLAEARKEELAAQGAGEADAVRLRGAAEAETMTAKAEAWSKYNEAAIADRLLSIMPQLAAAVSEPLSKTDKIVMLGGDGNGGVGAHRVTRDVMKIVAELPDVLESLTGKKLDELVKALPKTGESESASKRGGAGS
jgi:flotillin